MSRTVIVGAGPTGLYLALRLYELGMDNLLIIDPRQGRYTRPGHILNEVFIKAEEGLNLRESPWLDSNGHFRDIDNGGHIRDLEKGLYDLVIQRKIDIHAYTFVDVVGDEQHKSIRVLDENNQSSLIGCEQLFDCTGSSRTVIKAVNAKYSNNDRPFSWEDVVNTIPIKNHFLAYVRLSTQQKISLYNYESGIVRHGEIDDETKTPFWESLQELGWGKKQQPRVYSYPFKSDKHCIYMQAPEGLSEQDYERWVHAVLRYATLDPNMSFTTIEKNRGCYMQYFNIEPTKLDPLIFESDVFPTVYAQGDAIITPMYFLAHGIVNSYDRVNAFIDNITVCDNTINVSNAYFEEVEKYIKEHEKELHDHFAYVIAREHGVEKEILDNLGEEYVGSCYHKVLWQLISSSPHGFFNNSGSTIRSHSNDNIDISMIPQDASFEL